MTTKKVWIIVGENNKIWELYWNDSIIFCIFPTFKGLKETCERYDLQLTKKKEILGDEKGTVLRIDVQDLPKYF